MVIMQTLSDKTACVDRDDLCRLEGEEDCRSTFRELIEGIYSI